MLEKVSACGHVPASVVFRNLNSIIATISNKDKAIFVHMNRTRVLKLGVCFSLATKWLQECSLSIEDGYTAPTAKKDLLFWQLYFHQSCKCWHGFMGRYQNSPSWYSEHGVATGTIKSATRAGKIAWTADKCYMQQRALFPHKDPVMWTAVQLSVL